MKIKNLKAFTLAEVLIALLIIGIIATIILPTLLNNIKKAEYSSKLKKFYSTMSHAISLSELENGAAGGWLKEGGIEGDIEDEEGNPDFAKNSEVILKFVNFYLNPYLNITALKNSDRSLDDEKDYQGEAYMVLNDGSYVYLHNGNCIDFIYDVNGPKPPNTDGRDIYRFILCSNEKCTAHSWYTGKCGKFTTLGMESDNRSEALDVCKNTPKYCSRLLKMDDFEFKKDYPHKL